MKTSKYLMILSMAVFFSTGAVLLPAQEANRGKGYVNARELADSLGLSYRWFPMQNMVIISRGTHMMRLIVDQKDAVVDNKAMPLPGAPSLENGQVMVPARSILQVFGSPESGESGGSAAKPAKVVEKPRLLSPETPAEVSDEHDSSVSPGIPEPPPAIVKPVSAHPLAPPRIIDEPQEDQPEAVDNEEGATLLAVRHSKRDDQTRVVLEFDGPISFRSERPGDRKFKVRIDGCKNIIPTKRSNPAGRDIKAVSFNSGPNKQGLVVSFDLIEGGEPPTIETVTNPFRMVIAFKATPAGLAAASEAALLKAASETAKLTNKIASGTGKLASGTGKLASGTSKVAGNTTKAASGSAKLPLIDVPAVPAVDQPPSVDAPPAAKPMEWKNKVELESLTRSVFSGRTIMIDPGHGGRDLGAHPEGMSPEKDITLAVAIKLKAALKSAGFNALLLRSSDQDIPLADRHALANRAGGDLLICIHCGAAADENSEGTACYTYDSGGVSFDIETGSRLSPKLVYNEWVQNYRFDLAKFLAGKIRDRLVKHLEAKDRGVRPLPLLPLRFTTSTAVLVELGMLTNQTEGRKLGLAGYQEGAAKSIANGIIDFFNALKLNE
ncbi:MAG: N-acetylmuramoyl-L-alanine amidase [Candidatus Riflebacteria bacterium]|nr:N-acetylmuramoyl-L-alanine amidase [Candidatus Riflebacteria bacterium]